MDPATNFQIPEDKYRSNKTNHARFWAGVIFRGSWVQTITIDQPSPEP